MRSRKSLFFIPLAAALLAGPVLAASIAVVQPGLNGTGNALQVNAAPPGGQAVVISQHPVNERLFTMSFYVNTDTLSTCSAALTCRLFIARTFGNATGPFVDTFRVGLKRIANGAFRIIVWYKTPTSPNPGTWEAVNSFFLNAGGAADTKVTVEYTASSVIGVLDGRIRVFKDDVLADDTGAVLNLPNDIDNSRIGMVTGNILAGATGTFLLDEYVSTRAVAGP